MRILLISANRHRIPYPVYPLGTAYLKTYIGRHLAGAEVEVCDLNRIDDAQLDALIRRFAPEVVGISLRNVDGANSLDRRGFLDDYRQVVECVRRATRVPVVLGGAAFSIFPEVFMRELDADFGVVGEGEEPFTELVRRIGAGEPTDNIPAVICRGGSLCRLPRTYVASTDAEFEPDLVPYYWREGGMLNIQTKRGCPYHCIYCTYPHIDGRKVRTMPVDRLVDSIAQAKRDWGADYLFFTDSVFNICADYNAQLCEELIRRKVDIRWGAYFSPMHLSAEQLALYKAAGLTHIEFGTEAFSDRTLRAYGKQFTFEEVVAASELALKNDIYYAHFLILGGWGETPETLAETIENSRRLRHTVIFPYVGMRIYPHTPLCDAAVREGVIAPDDDLIAPAYYIAPGFDLAEARRMAAATGKAWIFPDEPQSELVDVLKLKKNKKGPLWEYLRKP